MLALILLLVILLTGTTNLGAGTLAPVAMDCGAAAQAGLPHRSIDGR